MITLDGARQIASDFLRNLRSNVDSTNFVISDASTREEPFGWVFFWNDRRFIETGDDLYALCGNLPVVVLRQTGQVMYLPWKKDRNSSIADFAASLNEK